MKTSEIIQFAATELGTDNSISVDCGKNFDIHNDFKCENGRKFSIENGFQDICANAEYGCFALAWKDRIQDWLDAIVNRAGARKVILLAFNGHRFDHLLLLKAIPALKAQDFLFADPFSGNRRTRVPFSLREVRAKADVQESLREHCAGDDVSILISVLTCRNPSFIDYVHAAFGDDFADDDLLSYTLRMAKTHTQLSSAEVSGTSTFEQLSERIQ